MSIDVKAVKLATLTCQKHSSKLLLATQILVEVQSNGTSPTGVELLAGVSSFIRSYGPLRSQQHADHGFVFAQSSRIHTHDSAYPLYSKLEFCIKLLLNSICLFVTTANTGHYNYSLPHSLRSSMPRGYMSWYDTSQTRTVSNVCG